MAQSEVPHNIFKVHCTVRSVMRQKQLDLSKVQLLFEAHVNHDAQSCTEIKAASEGNEQKKTMAGREVRDRDIQLYAKWATGKVKKRHCCLSRAYPALMEWGSMIWPSSSWSR